MVFCPLVAVVMLESRVARCVHCEEEAAINWLIFITEMKSVYCAVRTGSLKSSLLFVFKGLNSSVCVCVCVCVCRRKLLLSLWEWWKYILRLLYRDVQLTPLKRPYHTLRRHAREEISILILLHDGSFCAQWFCTVTDEMAFLGLHFSKFLLLSRGSRPSKLIVEHSIQI